VDVQHGSPPPGGGAGALSGSDNVRIWPAPEDTILVAYCRTGHGNTHAGVVFRDTHGRWMMFHQAWHKDTRYESLAEALSDMSVKSFVFAVVNYPTAIAKNAVHICRSIANVRQAIPFAFGFDNEATWDEATHRLKMPKGKGLTCVNFTVALFKYAGLTLIDWTDWPTRDEDKAFQSDILRSLASWCRNKSPDRRITEEDAAHLEEVRKEIESESGCARIRSEELIGAILSRHPKPKHDIAIPAGVRVTRIIDAFSTAVSR
jgi:hypothetical protein